jgi:two-component system, NarL family, response regulator NreC
MRIPLFPSPTSKEKTSLRILVADDHEIVRAGLKAILTRNPGWIVCGEASDGAETLALANQLRPNVVVMDLNMPGLMTSIEALRGIKDRLPDTAIVILTLYFSGKLIREVLEAGARAYVTKSDANRNLVDAVSAVAAGKTYFTEQASEEIEHAVKTLSPALPASALTAPEREAVRTLALTMRKIL